MEEKVIVEDTALDIEIQYLNDDIERLEFKGGYDHSDWVDMRSAVDITLKAGESAMIHLGVAMKLPAGYEAHIAPRSSTFKNFGLLQTNSVGIVDLRYCGPDDWWHMPVFATRDTVVHKGDRICQFRIIEKQPKLRFNTVERLEGENRGGLGSTGIK